MICRGSISGVYRDQKRQERYMALTAESSTASDATYRYRADALDPAQLRPCLSLRPIPPVITSTSYDDVSGPKPSS